MSESEINWHENEWGQLEGYIKGDKPCDPTFFMRFELGKIGLHVRYLFDNVKSAEDYAREIFERMEANK
jgi:hypothetical protein